MSDSFEVFNRQTVRRHRDRTAAGLDDHDFLFRESAERLCDRLLDVKRTFLMALDLGCHTGQLARGLCAGDRPGGPGGIETLTRSNSSQTGRAPQASWKFGPASSGASNAPLRSLMWQVAHERSKTARPASA